MKRLLFIVLILSLIMIPVVFGEDEIVYPGNGSKVRIDDIELKWVDTEESDYYLITVIDTTTSKVLVDNSIRTASFFVMERAFFLDEHVYRVDLIYVKGDKEKKVTSSFTIDDPNYIIQPIMFNPRVYETISKDLFFGWEPDVSADYYLVELKNLTDGKIIISEHVSDNEYEVKQPFLDKVKEYSFKVTTVKGAYKKSDEILVYIENKDFEYPVIHSSDRSNTFDLVDVDFRWQAVDSVDYYLVSLYDTTIESSYINKQKTEDNTYRVDKSDLTKGHNYKFKVAAVIDGVEKWSELSFDVTPIDMEDPEVKSFDHGDILPYASFDLKWQRSSFCDYYKVSIVDTDLDEVVLEETLKKSHMMIEKSVLKPGHSYAVYTSAYRDRRLMKDKTRFTVADIDVSSLLWIDALSTYHKDDAHFKWSPVEDVAVYVLSVQNTSTGEWVIDSKETSYSSYSIPLGLLDADTSYQVTLTAKGDYIEAVIQHNFVTHALVKGQVSQWAKSYVGAVKTKKILKEDLYDDLLIKPQASLTRLEFCKILVALYDNNNTNKTEVDLSLSKSFNDIAHLSDADKALVLKANALDIISGISDVSFNPDGLVTRQEMAVMLKNVYLALYGNTQTNEQKLTFKDENLISNWAKTGVNFSCHMGILVGDGDHFKPKEYATHEMGFVLLDKALTAFEK